MPEIIAAADDLSGAVETAAALAGRGAEGFLGADCVVLGTGDDIMAATADVVVVDTDSRATPAAEAAEIVGAVFDLVQDGIPFFKKIDSQLRGNTGAELGELRKRGPVVVSPALPALARTVIGGSLTLAEGDRFPAAERLDGLALTTIDLDAVRAGATILSDLITDAAGCDGVVLVDAVTDADLDILVDAVRELPVALAGSAALAAAIGRRMRDGILLEPAATPRHLPRDSSQERPTAIIVGSAEPIALRQFAEAERTGMPSIRIRQDSDIREFFTRDAQNAPRMALLVEAEYARGMTDTECLRRLAAMVADHVAAHDLVLTGGETARRVLDAVGHEPLHPVREIHWGAVLSVSESGRLVATRPGSFGNSSSLVDMADAVTDFRSASRLTGLARNNEARSDPEKGSMP